MAGTSNPIKSGARKFAVGVIIVTGFVAFLGFQLSGPRMPVYQGKSLSKWFGDFRRETQVQLAGGAPDGLESCCEAFRQFAQEAVPHLICELTNKSNLKAKYVALKSASPGWAFRILPQVQVGDWANRTAAARALGEIGPAASNAVPSLIEAISKTEIYESDKSAGASHGQSYSPQTRVEAIRALAKIAPGSREVIAALIEALKQKYTPVPVPFQAPASTVADAAAAALTNLGSEFKDQIPVMIANLKYQDQRQYRGAGIAAIYSVGALSPGYGADVPQLMNALHDPTPETRDAAAYDLGALRPGEREKAKTALPALVEALNDSQALIRIRASETILALDSLQSKMVLPTLLNLLRETNYLVRLRAIELLRQIGTGAKTAVPSLTNSLHDDSGTVQTWASETLERIDTQAAINGGGK